MPNHRKKFTDAAQESFGVMLLKYMNYLKKTGKSLHTLKAYRNDLNLLGEFLAENRASLESISQVSYLQWLEHLQQEGRKSHSSIRRAQMSVRAFIKFLISQKEINGSLLLELKSPTHPKSRLYILPAPLYERLKRSLQEQDTLKSQRDLVIVILLGEAGLKATELCRLKRSAVVDDIAHPLIHVQNRSERLIPISPESYRVIKSFIERTQALSEEFERTEYLLFGFQNITLQPKVGALNRHGLKHILYELTFHAFQKHWTAEDFRNMAIRRWIDKGLEIERVAEIAGYQSLTSLDKFFGGTDKFPAPSRRKRVRCVSSPKPSQTEYDCVTAAQLGKEKDRSLHPR